MLELLQESIKGYNLPLTILLGVVILYWVVALLGLVDIDIGGDFDLDVDTDAESGHEEGVDAASGNFVNSAMRFAGFADAPMMFVLSVFVVMVWVFNLIANMYFNPLESGTQATMLLLPVAVVGFVSTRLLVRPLRPVMKMLKAKEAPAAIIGEQAVVVSASLDHEFGRVQIDFDGRPLVLNAVISNQDQKLKKGAQVLVVSKIEDSENYIVRAL
ncbi:MAG: DUF1449 family protein [Verrucomicrobiales bacterium]|nr:DUF1449 family protein [Verrucomicrobiales bacterium]